MNAFLIALIAPALWAVANHFDKYIVGKYFKSTSVSAMMIFSALAGILVMPFAGFFQHTAFTINPWIALLIILNGWLYLVATLPYLKALKISDASVAVPMFQIIPVISFVLAWLFLGETLSGNQMAGGALVILGAIIISFEIQDGRKFKVRGDTLGLMLLSSLIFALNFLVFKILAIETDFWTTVFWESVGFVAFGVGLLGFVKPYRRDFQAVFRKNGKVIIGLNIFNEIINIVAKLVFNYASLLMVITMAWIAVGFQPVFVLIYSVILAILFPHISKENVTGKHLAQKLATVTIMLIGIYIIYT